jgi:hypothetical protein
VWPGWLTRLWARTPGFHRIAQLPTSAVYAMRNELSERDRFPDRMGVTMVPKQMDQTACYDVAPDFGSFASQVAAIVAVRGNIVLIDHDEPAAGAAALLDAN